MSGPMRDKETEAAEKEQGSLDALSAEEEIETEHCVDIEKLESRPGRSEYTANQGNDASSLSSTRSHGRSASQSRDGPNNLQSLNLSRTISEVHDGIQSHSIVEVEQPVDSKEATTGSEPDDPNLVGWSGPDDPDNPKNWAHSKKWAAVFIVSTFTLISPVSSSMVAPSLLAIGEELHISDAFQQVLVLSIFVLASAIGPLA